MTLLLNGFTTTFSGQKFHAFVQDLPDPETVTPLREKHGPDWFLHWREGKLYAIPRRISPTTLLGVQQELSLEDHLHLGVVSARINDCLPEKFPQYEAFRNRPFVFLGKRDEIVQKAVEGFKNLPPLVQLFKIRPRFELDARLYELRDRELRVGLFLSVDTKWDVLAPVGDLVAAGVDLARLHVVRRNPKRPRTMRDALGRTARPRQTRHHDRKYTRGRSLRRPR